MAEMVSITQDEYQEYLELKKEKNEAVKHVDDSLQALKEGKIHDL